MKIYIDTLGCPKNQNDSETAAGILEKAGHEVTAEPYGADVIMVNTCGFINDAKKESIDRIFEMADIKGEALLVVSGCLSQRYGEELYKEMPEVDLFIGVNEYTELPRLLSALAGKKAVSAEAREKYFCGPCDAFDNCTERKIAENPYTATLKIAEGCDNVCTYCIIPKIRGGYRSRRMEDVLAEAEMLAKKGCKELVLIAQDISAYGMDIYGKYSLAELLRRLCKIDGIRWIRLMYCYDDRITDELIEVMASEEKICHYIDIPIQHSSDRILTAMNRRSNRAGIVNTIKKLRAAMPDIHIRTTLITGFPGETREDFEDLCEFVAETAFERLGVFAYSKEEGTLAAEMKNQVRSDVKERRRDKIMRMQLEISLAKNQEKVGRVLEVMVDGVDEDGAYVGRSRYDAPEIDNSVIFTSERELRPGDIVNVEITDAFDYDLAGVEITCKSKLSGGAEKQARANS